MSNLFWKVGQWKGFDVPRTLQTSFPQRMCYTMGKPKWTCPKCRGKDPKKKEILVPKNLTHEQKEEIMIKREPTRNRSDSDDNYVFSDDSDDSLSSYEDSL